MIYVIETEDGRYIKVGYTQNGRSLKTRLLSLQTGNPQKLKVVGFGPGEVADEKNIHRWLSRHRSSGEWFDCEGGYVGNFRDEVRANKRDPLKVFLRITAKMRTPAPTPKPKKYPKPKFSQEELLFYAERMSRAYRISELGRR